MALQYNMPKIASDILDILWLYSPRDPTRTVNNSIELAIAEQPLSLNQYRCYQLMKD